MKAFVHLFFALAILAVAYAFDQCPKVNGEYVERLANPVDCRTFFKCETGVPILQECPKGLEYNAQLEVCDWPESANCLTAEYFEKY
ncbi:peritrophin-1-like [Neodiprion virginianus]|uniref:peritrophin-1-like n=1 Tax=Neodiprion virginianus TaxID=2961670 RepID=UPI001EE75C5F|nr:peritrophin-1-like [Neodiprion virginianus]